MMTKSASSDRRTIVMASSGERAHALESIGITTQTSRGHRSIAREPRFWLAAYQPTSRSSFANELERAKREVVPKLTATALMKYGMLATRTGRNSRKLMR